MENKPYRAEPVPEEKLFFFLCQLFQPDVRNWWDRNSQSLHAGGDKSFYSIHCSCMDPVIVLNLASSSSGFPLSVEVYSSNREAKVVLCSEMAGVEVIPRRRRRRRRCTNTLPPVLLKQHKHEPVDPYIRLWHLIAHQLFPYIHLQYTHHTTKTPVKFLFIMLFFSFLLYIFFLEANE